MEFPSCLFSIFFPQSLHSYCNALDRLKYFTLLDRNHQIQLFVLIKFFLYCWSSRSCPGSWETFLCSVRQSVFSVVSSYKNCPFAGYPSDTNVVCRVADIFFKKSHTYHVSCRIGPFLFITRYLCLLKLICKNYTYFYLLFTSIFNLFLLYYIGFGLSWVLFLFRVVCHPFFSYGLLNWLLDC